MGIYTLAYIALFESELGTYSVGYIDLFESECGYLWWFRAAYWRGFTR